MRVGIDSLENGIKWINIALMPLIVAVTGIALAVLRLKRRAAR